MPHSPMPIPLLDSKTCNLPFLKELMNAALATLLSKCCIIVIEHVYIIPFLVSCPLQNL